MTPYVIFDGISSITKGLRLVSAEPFILPRRTRQRESIPGRIGSIISESFETPAVGYRIRFALTGADKSAVVAAMHALADWLLAARVMVVWHEPGYYFTGAVEGEAGFSMLGRKSGTLDIEFLCDPPCRQRAKVSGATPWIPSGALPIPEQLTADNQTVSAANKTASFTLSAGSVSSALPPALHLAITGTWTSLSIGGTLLITEAFAASGTLYIDCDNQEVYRIVAGTRTAVSYSGDFPALSSGNLVISGTNISVSTARLLVIERG